MTLALMIIFYVLLLGVVLYSIGSHYATNRKTRGLLLITTIVVSVPVLALAIVVLASSAYAIDVKLWAMGVGALVVGFWLKNPLRDFNV